VWGWVDYRAAAHPLEVLGPNRISRKGWSMPMGARDEPFAAFVGAYRHRLIGTARLVHLDAEKADRLVDAVLAEVYASWSRLDDPYVFALRAVLNPAAVGARFAVGAVHDFELVDVDGLQPYEGDDIRYELAALTADERQILVLAAYARLPLVEIARVLGRDVTDVTTQLAAATERLNAMPRRVVGRRLTAELAAAAGEPDAGAPTAAPHGRSLLRRRRLRSLAAAAAVLLVTGIGAQQVVPLLTPAPRNVPQAAASPTTRPPCDVQQPRCRATLIATWRAEMAGVISSYLDPKGEYFTASGYSYTNDYRGAGFWNGGGGALSVDLYRAPGGATEVKLQIATSREYALPCGRTTKRECRTLRFMDGNRFTMTDPGTMTQGLEVRHRPDTDVITIVARNTSASGRELPVTRADLVTLIADKRLRLPAR
jgi:DNA-directed RNA polymerase specialized sigma24 family protein